MLFVALVLIAMGGSGVFVAISFRRHGTIDVQLLRDDAKASLSWATNSTSQMSRVRMSEEDADFAQDRGRTKLDWLRERMPESLVANLSFLSAGIMDLFGGAQKVTSASDGAPGGMDIAWEGGDDIGESASETGGRAAAAPPRSPRGGDRRGRARRSSKSTCDTSPRLNYEWDGPKLSWETGAGLAPDRLPDYQDGFALDDDGEEGEEGEEAC